MCGITLQEADREEFPPAPVTRSHRGVMCTTDKKVLSFVLRIAEKRKTDLSSIVNELLRKDMQLADALK
jgi:hypothetical protein